MIESCFFKQTPLNVAYHRLHTLTLTKFDLNLPWTLICFVHLAQSLRLERAKPCDPLDDWTRRLVSFQGLQFAQLLIVVFRTCEMLQRLLLIFYVCTATSLASKVFGWFGADLTCVCVCFFQVFGIDPDWCELVVQFMCPAQRRTKDPSLHSLNAMHRRRSHGFWAPLWLFAFAAVWNAPAFTNAVRSQIASLASNVGVDLKSRLGLRFNDADKDSALAAQLFDVDDYDGLPRRFDRDILLDFFSPLNYLLCVPFQLVFKCCFT